MNRTVNLLLNGPILPIVTATAGVSLYWVLRVVAKRSASYGLMVAEFGAPTRIERIALGVFIAACYVLLVYRLAFAAS